MVPMQAIQAMTKRLLRMRIWFIPRRKLLLAFRWTPASMTATTTSETSNIDRRQRGVIAIQQLERLQGV